MKNKIILKVILTIMVFGLGSPMVSAQGFAAIIEITEKLEQQLDELENNQKKDISAIRNQLSKAQSNANLDLAELNKSVSTFQTRLDQFEGNLTQLQDDQPELLFASVDSTFTVLDTRLNQFEGNLSQLQEFEGLVVNLRSLVGELTSTLAAPAQATPSSVTVPDEAEESAPSDLEITGFADFNYVVPSAEETSASYGFGQIEIDLATGIGDYIGVEAALAYDPDAETFGSGAFVVDVSLFGSEGDHYLTMTGIDHGGVLAGQFDVPFGIDLNVYPSIDRKLVSGPLVVEHTHDGWNDHGVQFYVEQSKFNLVAYSSNGFGYVYADTVDVEMKSALGGRLGFTPFDMLELGGSYATFTNEDDKSDMTLTGVDLQFSYGGFSLKSEYILHAMGLEADETVTNSGYYAQGMYEFGNFFVVGRQGLFSTDVDGVDDLTRTSIGGGWVIAEGAELRVEQQINSENDEKVTFIQLVVGF